MLLSITNLIILFILGTISLAKEFDNVFTSLDSITLSSHSSHQIPFSFYDVKVSWNIDTDVVATGDTFSLRMPYVYQVRIYNNGILSTYFDITSNGETVASCEVDNAGGRSLQTTITCTVTADVSRYTSLSGVIDFTVTFDNGGRIETMEASTHWVEGWNIVTFNDDLVNGVFFESVSTTSSQFLSRLTMRGDTFYYYASPQDICGRFSIRSGSFMMSIEKNGYEIELYSTEAATTSEINPFGMPNSYSTLAGADTYLLSENQVRVDFGHIPRGSRFWMSTFSINHFDDYSSYTVTYNYEVRCFSGRRAYDSQRIQYSAVAANAGGDGNGVNRPVTITSTTSWPGCSTKTRYNTGTDSTVSQIVEVPQSSCVTSTSSQKLAGSSATSPVVYKSTASISVDRASSSGFSRTEVVAAPTDIPEAMIISSSASASTPASTSASTFTEGGGNSLTYETKSFSESAPSLSLENALVESGFVSLESDAAANTASVEFSDVYSSSLESASEEPSMSVSAVEATTTIAAGITVQIVPGSSVDGTEVNSGSVKSDHVAAGSVLVSSQASYRPPLASSESFAVSSSIELFNASTVVSSEVFTIESAPIIGLAAPTQRTSEMVSTSHAISVTNSSMEITAIVSSTVLLGSSRPEVSPQSLSFETQNVSVVGVADLYTSLENSTVEAPQSDISDHTEQSTLTSHISSTSLLTKSTAISDWRQFSTPGESSLLSSSVETDECTGGYSTSASVVSDLTASISSSNGTTSSEVILSSAIALQLSVSSDVTFESSTPDQSTVLESHGYSSETSDELYMTTTTVLSEAYSGVSSVSSISAASHEQISLAGHYTVVSTEISSESRYFATATLSRMSETYSSTEMLLLDPSSLSSSESTLHPTSSSNLGLPLWLNVSSSDSNNFLDATSESSTIGVSEAIVTSASITSLTEPSTLDLAVPSEVYSLSSEGITAVTDESSILTSSSSFNASWSTAATLSNVESSVVHSVTTDLVHSVPVLSDAVGLESSLDSNRQVLTSSSFSENYNWSTLHSEPYETASYEPILSEPTLFAVNTNIIGVALYSSSESSTIISDENTVSSESSSAPYTNSSMLSSAMETTVLLAANNIAYVSTAARSETASSFEGVIASTSTLTSTTVDETPVLQALESSVFEMTYSQVPSDDFVSVNHIISVSANESIAMKTVTLAADKTVSTLSSEITPVSSSEGSLSSMEISSSLESSEELSSLSESESTMLATTNGTMSSSSSSISMEYTLAPGRTFVTISHTSHSDTGSASSEATSSSYLPIMNMSRSSTEYEGTASAEMLSFTSRVSSYSTSGLESTSLELVSTQTPATSAEAYQPLVASSNLSSIITTDSEIMSSAVDIVTATSLSGESVEDVQNSTSSGETGSTWISVSDNLRESSVITSSLESETSVPSSGFFNSSTLLDPRGTITPSGGDTSLELLYPVDTGSISTSDDKPTARGTPEKTIRIRSTISTAVIGGLSTSEVISSHQSILVSLSTDVRFTTESDIAVHEATSQAVSSEVVPANLTSMSSDFSEFPGSSSVETAIKSEVATSTLLVGATLIGTGTTTSEILSISGSSISADLTIGLTHSGSLNISEIRSSRFMSTDSSSSYSSDDVAPSLLNSNSYIIPTQTDLISSTMPTESYLVASSGNYAIRSGSASTESVAITSSGTNHGAVITSIITHITLVPTSTPSGNLIDTSYYNSEDTHSPHVTTMSSSSSAIISTDVGAYTYSGISPSSSNNDISPNNGNTNDSAGNIGTNSANDISPSSIADGETKTSIISADSTADTSIYATTYSNTGSIASTTVSSQQTTLATESHGSPSSSLPFALKTNIPQISTFANSGFRPQHTLGGIVTMVLVNLFFI